MISIRYFGIGEASTPGDDNEGLNKFMVNDSIVAVAVT